MRNYITDAEFINEDYTKKGLERGEYENCTFENCNFAGSNLAEVIFVECTFDNCDFSNAKLLNTSFREVQFDSCKLLGLHFDECNPFLITFHFTACTLNFSSFYKLKLKGSRFTHCNLQEVDFTETDLSLSNFTECDFNGTAFDRSILEGTDFRTSFNFVIDPENNRIKKAKFSRNTLAGLLKKYQIQIDN
jgi:uncharacterized protein YjbI with pentapeptide repeats